MFFSNKDFLFVNRYKNFMNYVSLIHTNNMHLTLLQFFLIITCLVFFIFWIDLFKHKKANILHIIVFVWWAALLIFFTINWEALNKFWMIFGLARWSDIIVYASIILLAYFYIWILNTQTRDQQELTRLISMMAIHREYENVKDKIKSYKNTDSKDDFILNIRVYNESKMVGKVIDEIISAGFKKLVLINDWSKDNSLEILQEKQKEYWDCLIVVLSHEINRWWWAANQTWYKFIQNYAKELQVKWFVGFDSDWQMDIKDMETFMKAIEKDKWTIDAYLWSRFVKWWTAENIPTSRRIVLAISRFVTLLLYHIKVSDPHNWYRVIKMDAFKQIRITADWMHYANEVNEQIKKLKLTRKEIPVHIRYTDYSLWKWQKNSNSFKLAVEMIYKLIFFR